jgi:putative transposase
VRDVCAELRKFNGETDHAHLLVHHPPKIAPSRPCRPLKGVPARRPRQEFPSHIPKYQRGDHSRSPSYLAASCGGPPLAIIKEYTEQQKRPAWAWTDAIPPGPERPRFLASHAEQRPRPTRGEE